MVSRFCVRPATLRWAEQRDHETLSIACQVGLRVGVSFIQTPLVSQAIKVQCEVPLRS